MKRYYQIICTVKTDIPDPRFNDDYQIQVGCENLMEALEMSAIMQKSLRNKTPHIVQGCTLVSYDGIEEVTVRKVD